MRTGLLACAAALLCVPSAVAATTLAVLGVDSPRLDPVLPLLEVKAAALPDVVPVDRVALQVVLAEQRLQATLAADATGRRAALGRILKADVLVLLQAHEKPQPHAQVIVCETHRGLRLCVEPVELTADPDADAQAMLEPIRQALAKHREQITSIIAVPPFLDDSLTRDTEYLCGTLPKLIERELLRQPGVLVVELDEARSIAREADLGGQEIGDRALPLYLLGEFRFEPDGERRKASFGLKMMRGQQELDARSRRDVDGTQLVPGIQRAAAELIEEAIGKQPTAADPVVESEQLANRARVFRKFGNWREASALFEASLLVRPDQPGVHGEAAFVIDKILDEARPFFDGGSVELDVQTLERMRPALVHLEAYFLGTTFPMTQRVGDKDLWLAPATWSKYRRARPRTQAHLDALNAFFREHVAMIDRVLQAKAAKRVQDATLDLLYRFAEPPADPIDPATPAYKAWLQRGLPGFLEHRRRLVDAFIWLDQDRRAWHWFLSVPGDIQALNAPDHADARDLYVAFLREIADKPNPKLAAEARNLLGIMGRGVRAKAPPPVAAAEPARRDPQDVDLVRHPIALELATADGRSVPWTEEPTTWEALGSLGDVIATKRGIHRMTSAGTLIQLPFEWGPLGDEHLLRLTDRTCTDTRHAWIAVPGDQPVLAAIDLESRRVWRLTEANGLPSSLLSGEVVMSPLAPGRIGIAGFFGRTWCGIATLDPAKGIALDVIFEAKEPRDLADAHQDPARVANQVQALITISGRRAPDQPVESRLLLVSPDTRALLIHPETGAVERSLIGVNGTMPCIHEGALYWGDYEGATSPDPADRRYLLCRLGFPDLQSTVVNRQPPGELYVVHEGEVIAVPSRGYPLCAARTFADTFRPLTEEVANTAPITRLWTSSVYGLVVAQGGKLYRMERVKR